MAIRYNQVRQLSSHNSYNDNGPKDDIETQFCLGVRSFELDLHNAAPGNWDIYHVFPSANNFVGDLNDALTRFKRLHDANPTHEVVTIWLELKDDWHADGHMPSELDQQIDSGLPSLIYTPASLMGIAQGATSLRDAVGKVGWPYVEHLRGKFIFVLMGNDAAAEQYLRNRGHVGSCFVAPEDDLLEKLGPTPEPIWLDSIFLNCHNVDGPDTPQTIYHVGLVSRIWRVDDQEEYDFALSTKAHHIATDHVTRNLFMPLLVDATGHPFRPFDE